MGRLWRKTLSSEPDFGSDSRIDVLIPEAGVNLKRRISRRVPGSCRHPEEYPPD